MWGRFLFKWRASHWTCFCLLLSFFRNSCQTKCTVFSSVDHFSLFLRRFNSRRSIVFVSDCVLNCCCCVFTSKSNTFVHVSSVSDADCERVRTGPEPRKLKFQQKLTDKHVHVEYLLLVRYVNHAQTCARIAQHFRFRSLWRWLLLLLSHTINNNNCA